MPELPEAERARRVLERHAVGRTVVEVDDGDRYVCRPHPPGEIAGVLRGLAVLAAGRRGKALWLETDGGIELGLHLGMSGSVVVDEPVEPHGWDRFTLVLDDGTRLPLRDKRRLSRAVLDPDRDRLGPDALGLDRAELHRRVGRGRLAIKARLLDQGTVAGVGNLLADEALWLAGVDPRRPAGSLAERELDALHTALQTTLRAALGPRGGSGRGLLATARRDRVCPRCGATLLRAAIGGRTTLWCPVDQPSTAVGTGSTTTGPPGPPVPKEIVPPE